MEAATGRLNSSRLSFPPLLLFPRQPSAVPAASILLPPKFAFRWPSMPPLRLSLAPPPDNCFGSVFSRSTLSCLISESSAAQASSPSCRIFIKGLSHSTPEGVLKKAFSSFGEVEKVKIITSKSTKESLGLAYIWFSCEEGAIRAVKEMDGKFFCGRFIAVRIASPESASMQIKVGPYKF